MINLEFRFLEIPLVSTNDCYVPAYKYIKLKGKRKGYKKMYMHKSDELKEFQAKIARSFEQEFFYSKEKLRHISSLVNGLLIGLEFDMKVSMPKDIYFDKDDDLARHDASNYIKATEDAIMSGIGIDDKRNIKVSVEKGYNEDGVWMFEVYIRDRNIDNRIDVNIDRAYIKSEEGDD